MEAPDWNLIRSFVAVGETGSLSAAARRLRSSQPTVGRHIETLEEALGVKLFLRGKRGYELTETGADLMERGKAAANAMAGFSLRAAGTEERMAGTVRIAASELIATYVLPTIVARLLAEEPALELEIVASDRVENLLRRDADIAVRMMRPTQLDIVARKIADIPLRMCAARSYLDRRGRPTSLADLADHELAGFDRSDLIIVGMAELGLKVRRSRFRLRTDSQPVFWEAMRAGNGIGFAQAPMIERDAQVEALMPDLAPASLPMWLAMHRDVQSSRRIRRVADALGQGLGAYVRGI